MKVKTRATLNTFFLIATIAVNFLANALPIGGMTTGELSALYPNLFVPAGLTFSIWGVIYLLLIGFVVWQWFSLSHKKTKELLKHIGPWFVFSCVANMGRILAWHYTWVGTSVIIMLAILTSLIVLSRKVKMGSSLGSWNMKWGFHIPFGVYLGWISVATIANISAYLVSIGWGMRGASDIFWTIVVIGVATILAFFQLAKYYNIPFALVVLWAFYGIAIKRIDVDPIYAIDILWALAFCSALISGGIGWRWKKRLKN